MIPILYDSTETEFTTNGLGRLPEATECFVTEERNGSYELSMQVPVSAKHFSDIKNTRLILAKPNALSDPQPFEVYDISTPIGGIAEVSARHISYRLSDIPCKPFSASSVTEVFDSIPTYAMEECPFEFWTDKSTIANYSQTAPASIRSRLGGVDGSILDCYGGEYEFDRFTVKLWNNRGADRGVTIRYGKNLTDAKQEQSIADTCTGIVGYWADSTGGTCIYTDVVQSDNADNFPYHKTQVIDFSSDYEEQPTVATLTARAQSYVSNNNIGVPDVSIDVSFVDLADTEEYKNLSRELIGLCDTVTVKFEALGINNTAKVTKTVYNVLQERYDSITLGTYYTLASTVSGISSNVTKAKAEVLTELEKAKSSATAQITGANGGYVKINYDADGNPYEILVMDTDDVSTATKIWRWNQNGLGYSSTGYNGEYGLAMTQDGAIVADYITSGTLIANLIKAGLLSDAAGTNYWNMETGEFSLSAATKVGSSTVASVSDVSSAQSAAETYADNAAAAAEAAASDLANAAKSTADGKITTFYQASAPTSGMSTGDLWIDTDNGNNLYRYNGSSWDDIQDGAIGTALSNAATAQSTADSKIVTFAQASAPTATDVGDIWIDTDDNNQMYRWSGSAWVAYRDGMIAESLAEAKEYADSAASDAVDAQTQADIFNKLTNDGETQGIYLSDGKLYINASYIATGTLKDTGGNTTLNLSTGTLTIKKGSINLGNGTFKVDEDGSMTASSANLYGTVITGRRGTYTKAEVEAATTEVPDEGVGQYTKLDDGEISGGFLYSDGERDSAIGKLNLISDWEDGYYGVTLSATTDMFLVTTGGNLYINLPSSKRIYINNKKTTDGSSTVFYLPTSANGTGTWPVFIKNGMIVDY